MAELAVKPCRIAFDNLAIQKEYFDAMSKAIKYGIKHFSNYMLYNYDEKPESIWERLNMNIEFCEQHNKDKIFLFSFPMKYAAIDHIDREYVGKYWNKKYLRAMNVILNVTSGIVAKEKDFFVRAFGSDKQEFLEILTMPDEFIRYRDFFERVGLRKKWRECFYALTKNERKKLITILEKMVEEPEVMEKRYTPNLDTILLYYRLSKKKVENNLGYYMNLVGD